MYIDAMPVRFVCGSRVQAAPGLQAAPPCLDDLRVVGSRMRGHTGHGNGLGHHAVPDCSRGRLLQCRLCRLGRLLLLCLLLGAVAVALLLAMLTASAWLVHLLGAVAVIMLAAVVAAALALVVAIPMLVPPLAGRLGAAQEMADLQTGAPVLVICQLFASGVCFLWGLVLYQRMELVANDDVVGGVLVVFIPVLHLSDGLGLSRVADAHHLHHPTLAEQLGQAVYAGIATGQVFCNNSSLCNVDGVCLRQRVLPAHSLAVGTDDEGLRLAERTCDAQDAVGERLHPCKPCNHVEVHPSVMRLPDLLQQELVRWEVGVAEVELYLLYHSRSNVRGQFCSVVGLRCASRGRCVAACWSIRMPFDIML
mmetsp:Transcript_15627/g.43714  ORF Transcript_15627/g.43714 Transcript_15627/m.43714 type:complete len:365 (-) Transcript_15627:204-1298(-)